MSTGICVFHTSNILMKARRSAGWSEQCSASCRNEVNVGVCPQAWYVDLRQFAPYRQVHDHTLESFYMLPASCQLYLAGLKFGMYSDAGSHTCLGYPGKHSPDARKRGM